MYKMALLDDLYQDYKDAAEKYQEYRNEDAEIAMEYVGRMKCIGKCIKYTQQMIDGTMGKHYMPGDHVMGAQGSTMVR